jgi:hypothetical protein
MELPSDIIEDKGFRNYAELYDQRLHIAQIQSSVARFTVGGVKYTQIRYFKAYRPGTL